MAPHWGQSLAQGRDGTIWAATTSGLYEVNGGRLRRHGTADGLAAESLVSVLVDSAGTLWVGTGPSGLMRVAPPGLVSFTSRDGLLTDKVSQILPDGRGGVLLVGFPPAVGVHRVEGDRPLGTRFALPAGIRELGWAEAQAVLVDHLGDWWVPTGQALLRYARPARLEDLGSVRPFATYGTSGARLAGGLSHLRGLARRRVAGPFGDGPAGSLGAERPAPFAASARPTACRRSRRRRLPRMATARCGSASTAAAWRAGATGGSDGSAADEGIPPGFVSALLVDRRGRLWAGSAAHRAGPRRRSGRRAPAGRALRPSGGPRQRGRDVPGGGRRRADLGRDPQRRGPPRPGDRRGEALRRLVGPDQQYDGRCSGSTAPGRSGSPPTAAYRACSRARRGRARGSGCGWSSCGRAVASVRCPRPVSPSCATCGSPPAPRTSSSASSASASRPVGRSDSSTGSDGRNGARSPRRGGCISRGCRPGATGFPCARCAPTVRRARTPRWRSSCRRPCGAVGGSSPPQRSSSWEAPRRPGALAAGAAASSSGCGRGSPRTCTTSSGSRSRASPCSRRSPAARPTPARTRAAAEMREVGDEARDLIDATSDMAWALDPAQRRPAEPAGAAAPHDGRRVRRHRRRLVVRRSRHDGCARARRRAAAAPLPDPQGGGPQRGAACPAGPRRGPRRARSRHRQGRGTRRRRWLRPATAPMPRCGHGMTSMRRRAEELGGTLDGAIGARLRHARAGRGAAGRGRMNMLCPEWAVS